MRHDWVFEVLRDLMAYAVQNDLPALAAKVQATLAVAEVEVAAKQDQPPERTRPQLPGRPH